MGIESQLFNSMITVRTLFGLHLYHHLILQDSQNTFLIFNLQKLCEYRHTRSWFIRDSNTPCKYKPSEKDYNSSYFYYFK